MARDGSEGASVSRGARVTPIADSLKVIVAALKKLRRPVANRLRPPLAKREIDAWEKTLPFSLTSELKELYAVTNGVQITAREKVEAGWLVPGFRLLGLDEAIVERKSRARAAGWKPSFMPVFTDDAGDYYVVSCTPRDKGVIGYVRGEPNQEVEYDSLRAMFATLAACFAGKAFVVDKGRFTIKNDKQREIAATLNPGVSFWKKSVGKLDRAGAEKQAKEAYALARKKNVAEALRLLEPLLEVKGLAPWVYVNASYAAIADNNKQPVDRARVQRVLDACLPHGKEEPDIFSNAAFLYMDVGQPDLAVAALHAAKQGGVKLAGHLKDPAFDPLRNHPRFATLAGPGAKTKK